MEYLLLAYRDEQRWEALSASERKAWLKEWLAYNELLRKHGRLLAWADLPSRNAALLVRVQQGQLALTAGPLVETKEELIGLFFIKATDLNDAIRVAANMPQAHAGVIEIRPVME